jgi:hypothetical protein
LDLLTRYNPGLKNTKYFFRSLVGERTKEINVDYKLSKWLMGSLFYSSQDGNENSLKQVKGHFTCLAAALGT